MRNLPRQINSVLVQFGRKTELEIKFRHTSQKKLGGENDLGKSGKMRNYSKKFENNSV
jgi:hypothetical protein